MLRPYLEVVRVAGMLDARSDDVRHAHAVLWGPTAGTYVPARMLMNVNIINNSELPRYMFVRHCYFRTKINFSMLKHDAHAHRTSSTTKHLETEVVDSAIAYQ